MASAWVLGCLKHLPDLD